MPAGVHLSYITFNLIPDPLEALTTRLVNSLGFSRTFSTQLWILCLKIRSLADRLIDASKKEFLKHCTLKNTIV